MKLLKHEEEMGEKRRRFYHSGLVGGKKAKSGKTYLEQYFYKVKNSLFAIQLVLLIKLRQIKVNEGCYSICALLLLVE